MAPSAIPPPTPRAGVGDLAHRAAACKPKMRLDSPIRACYGVPIEVEMPRKQLDLLPEADLAADDSPQRGEFLRRFYARAYAAGREAGERRALERLREFIRQGLAEG